MKIDAESRRQAAERHFRFALQIVAQQRAQIEQLEASGMATTKAKGVLLQLLRVADTARFQMSEFD